jgi:uncharacterized membrane protein HdeD (DUF308 family)
MWRKQLTGVIALVAGVVLLAGGIVDHVLAAPKAALCDSGIGQVGQALDNTVAHDCGLVTALESAVGWLIVVGVLALLLGIAVLVNSRLTRVTPSPAPATPPAPQPPPANRPWWEQN